MTRDEVRELIATAMSDYWNSLLDTTDVLYVQTVAGHMDQAEAVLAAFAARGIVLGERNGFTGRLVPRVGVEAYVIDGECPEFRCTLVRVVQ